jgi:hypothetical protein
MATKVVRVQIDTPEAVSAEARELAEQRGEEAAILALWEAGEMSASRAATELGLSAHEFLDLLASKNLPVVRDFDPDAVAEVRQRLSGRENG